MNESLQAELVAFLQQVNAALQKGGEFALEQAPLIVQEKLLVGRIVLTLALLCIPLVVWAAVRFGKAAYQNDDDPLSVILAIITGVGALMATLAVVPAFITVWFAPRVYILEWISGYL